MVEYNPKHQQQAAGESGRCTVEMMPARALSAANGRACGRTMAQNKHLPGLRSDLLELGERVLHSYGVHGSRRATNCCVQLVLLASA